MIDAFNGFTFADVFPDYATFKTESTKWGFTINMKEEDLSRTYYNLLANYANSHARTYDQNRFEMKVFTIIDEYGPNWAKKLFIQNELRNMTMENVQEGTKQIHNSAFGDEVSPTTTSTEETDFISSQNVSNVKRGKADALAMQYALLQDNITKEFMDRFKPLFVKIAYPRNPILYETEVKEQ